MELWEKITLHFLFNSQFHWISLNFIKILSFWVKLPHNWIFRYFRFTNFATGQSSQPKNSLINNKNSISPFQRTNQNLLIISLTSISKKPSQNQKNSQKLTNNSIENNNFESKWRHITNKWKWWKKILVIQWQPTIIKKVLYFIYVFVATCLFCWFRWKNGKNCHLRQPLRYFLPWPTWVE